ncbi:MAG TPA: hypothetical protein PK950_00615, partial [Candidatus Paceibacterota bacterium]|nr:hypothetical protein [Candidatus Paceibacterota bacterium]
MNKNIFTKTFIVASLAVFVLAAGIFSAKAIGPNLIANPGFEDLTAENTPAHWATGGFGNNDRAVTHETLDDLTKAGKVAITLYT